MRVSRYLPLIAPRPPRLSQMSEALAALEASGRYSNNGPHLRRFEAVLVARLFAGEGAALGVANATLGLILALADGVGRAAPGRLALMPAFTFAATAQAAIWAGLTPLLCDIDPEDWTALEAEEDRLLAQHGDRIAAVVPYAAFGTAIDLDRYAWLQRRRGLTVVVDAAASLGTIDADGRGFGTGFPGAVVYSMHATKTFATGEGGVVYSADPARVARLRAMAGFGFEAGRSATLLGLNAKLSELAALLALAKLDEIDAVADHRAALDARYRLHLADMPMQRPRGRRQAVQFASVLLPDHLLHRREAIIAALAARGVGAAHYFSPHLAEQPYFQASCTYGPLPASDAVAARVLSLPITDAMSLADVDHVCAMLRAVVAAEEAPCAEASRSHA